MTARTQTPITPILALIFGVLALAIGELRKLGQGNAAPLLSAGLSVGGAPLPLIIAYPRTLGSDEPARPTSPPGSPPGYPPPGGPGQSPPPPPPPRRVRSGG